MILIEIISNKSINQNDKWIAKLEDGEDTDVPRLDVYDEYDEDDGPDPDNLKLVDTVELEFGLWLCLRLFFTFSLADSHRIPWL